MIRICFVPKKERDIYEICTEHVRDIYEIIGNLVLRRPGTNQNSHCVVAISCRANLNNMINCLPAMLPECLVPGSNSMARLPSVIDISFFEKKLVLNFFMNTKL